MLKFDSWPPKRGEVHFTEPALKAMQERNAEAAMLGHIGTEILLANTSEEETRMIIGDLVSSIPDDNSGAVHFDQAAFLSLAANAGGMEQFLANVVGVSDV